jgi:D-beta-D-heptose 7-phosphate kinase/D-beta-D-heptose 1-phosphate adenosyltransferase
MNVSKNIQQHKKFKILLIGDDCVDVYQYGTVDRISPEAPVPVFKYEFEETRPGMAANVKANLEVLGCEVHYLHGKTTTKTRLIDRRSKQHIVRIDNDIRSLPLVFIDTVELYDAIVISDYDKGTVSYDLVKTLRQSYHGPIFIDTKKRDLTQFKGCIVKINAYEFSLLESNSADDIIVTQGDKGAEWKGTLYPANRVEVADVCGAGDTFLSALTFQYLTTKNMIEAIKFAINASSVTVQHLGVYAPTLQEIL